MELTGKMWIFFNVKSQVKTDPMPAAKAYDYLHRIDPQDHKFYLGWTPGWKQWLTCKEILKNYTHLFIIPPSTQGLDMENTKSSLTGTGSEHTYTEIQLNQIQPLEDEFRPELVNWEKTPALPTLKKESDQRKYKRFPHRIEIVIMTKQGKSFRSSSANISLGGVLLREPVPADILKEAMDVVIVNPFPDNTTPSHLLMKGQVVGDIKDKRRLMFYDLSDEVQKKLFNILDKYKTNYQAYKSKKVA